MTPDTGEWDEWAKLAAANADAKARADERGRTIGRLWIALGVATAVAAGSVVASIAGWAKASQPRPAVAVIDPGSRTVQWVEPDIAQQWTLFRSNEEAFALNAVRCMESFHRAIWHWNWAQCRELSDAKAWGASLEYRFQRFDARERPDVLEGRYRGEHDQAEVKFPPFAVRLWNENGGRFARVQFEKTEWIGGTKRVIPMEAELTYYVPDEVPAEPSALGKAVNPAQLRMVTYKSDGVQR